MVSRLIELRRAIASFVSPALVAGPSQNFGLNFWEGLNLPWRGDVDGAEPGGMRRPWGGARQLAPRVIKLIHI